MKMSIKKTSTFTSKDAFRQVKISRHLRIVNGHGAVAQLVRAPVL